MGGVAEEPFVLQSTRNRILTITLNRPKSLNGFSQPMGRAVFEAMASAASDTEIAAVILTGTGKYYCAGADFGAGFAPAMPKTIRRQVFEENKALFDQFLDFPKPLFAALNGPAIGMAVTHATLCDAIIASETATLQTPFTRLGISPEGIREFLLCTESR
jgi:enoyl-CoA hydratase/carnithine racemase